MGGGSIGKKEKNECDVFAGQTIGKRIFDALAGEALGKRMFDSLSGESLGKRSSFSRLIQQDGALTQVRSKQHYLSRMQRPVTNFDVLAGQALGKRTYFDALARHSLGNRHSFAFSEN